MDFQVCQPQKTRVLCHLKPLPGFTNLFGVQFCLQNLNQLLRPLQRAKSTRTNSTRLYKLLQDGNCTFRPYTSLYEALQSAPTKHSTGIMNICRELMHLKPSLALRNTNCGYKISN